MESRYVPCGGRDDDVGSGKLRPSLTTSAAEVAELRRAKSIAWQAGDRSSGGQNGGTDFAVPAAKIIIAKANGHGKKV